MRKLFLFFTCLLLALWHLSSCQWKQNKGRQAKLDSISEANWIAGMVANSPDFRWDNNENLSVKTINDSVPGIKIKLYAWHHNSRFDDMIIYVTNDKGFRYAFPYNDEKLYCWANEPIYVNDDLIPKDSISQDIIVEQTGLEREFNYMISKLGLNQVSKKNELQRFITLFEDSLLVGELGHKELTLKDTSRLLYMASEGIKKPDGSKDSSEIISRNFRRIVHDLRNNKNGLIRFFWPYEGFGGFWRFEITESVKGYRLYVKITFINKEGYAALFI